jgi:hypothetical protein
LALPRYFDVPVRLMENALAGPFNTGKNSLEVDDFVVFDALRAGRPDRAKRKWVFDMVTALETGPATAALRPEILPKVFRADIFDRALKLYEQANRTESPPFFPMPAPHHERAAGGNATGPSRYLEPVGRNRFPCDFGAGPSSRTNLRTHLVC